jgi:hypothetical protein
VLSRGEAIALAGKLTAIGGFVLMGVDSMEYLSSGHGSHSDLFRSLASQAPRTGFGPFDFLVRLLLDLPLFGWIMAAGYAIERIGERVKGRR